MSKPLTEHSMNLTIPQFGIEIPGCDYVLRPGSYGVIRNQSGGVAVVFTPLGVFLPGGGREAGESDEAALLREVMEECGLHIQISHRIGVADELVFAKNEQCYFRKRSIFFAAELAADAPLMSTEPDHRLLWLPVGDALQQLHHESQRWALNASAGSSGVSM